MVEGERGQTQDTNAVLLCGGSRGRVPTDAERKSGAATIREISYEQLQEAGLLRQAIIHTYQQVFRGSPWYQELQCQNPRCQQVYTLSQYQHLFASGEAAVCIACADPQFSISDPHTADKVWKRMEAELRPEEKKTPFLFAASEGNAIIGFLWGFGDRFPRVTEYIQNTYFSGLPPERAAALLKQMQTALGAPARVAYISEIGVIEERRNGRVMLQLMKACIEKQLPPVGDEQYLFWTSKGKQPGAAGLLREDIVLMAGSGRDLSLLLGDEPERNFIQILTKQLRQQQALTGALPIRPKRVKEREGSQIYGVMQLLGAKEITRVM